ncbi:MAG: hypothetical protein WDO56_06285 [Gammaproteobacteria bacterium]
MVILQHAGAKKVGFITEPLATRKLPGDKSAVRVPAGTAPTSVAVSRAPAAQAAPAAKG